MRLEAGTTIANVTLARRLGAGGQGEVWAARREGGGLVAVKILEPGDSHGVLRAMREARLQRQVHHPNIVRIHEFQLLDGMPLIISELVDGLSLRQLLRKGRPPKEQVDRIVQQLFNGVEAAHAHGLVHRDLKPGNVLLTWKDDGYVAKITDFGIAVEAAPFRPGDDLAGRGQAVGTAGFMAPEQHMGNELVDERADLFGLGAVLYWMVTGRRAFSGSSWLEVVERSAEGRFTPIPVIAPDAPSAWARAIHWALDPSPRRRPPDVSVLRRAWLGHERFPDWVSLGVDELKPEKTASDDVTQVHSPLPEQTDLSLALSFGRDEELEGLQAKLENHQVVTLKGPPGIGKTHLATRTAASMLRHDWGWVQAYLTEAESMVGLLVAISAGLGLSPGGKEPEAQLARAIGGRGRTVFVLDNAEQVVGPLAELLPQLVAAAPEARFLVTSRRPIGVQGEVVVELGPLDPSSARALFQDRARRRRPNLRFAETEQQTVNALVEALEGNPLALELAAARAMQQSSEELLEDLREDRSQERAMEVALAWSWRLLTPWERHVLGCCAVFKGGLFAEALEDMLDLSPWPEAPDAMAILHGLADQSLMAQRSIGEADSRLYPYQSVRAFVLGKLHPNERERAERAHLAWFARLGGEAGMALRKGPAGLDATRRLLCEGENLVHALDTAIRVGESTAAVNCAAAMGEVLLRVGLPVAGVPKVKAALAMDGQTGRDRARLYLVLGHLLRDSNQAARAVSALQTALTLAQDANAPVVHAEALTRLGVLAHHQGQPLEAEERFEAALAVLPEDAPAWREALVLRQLCAVQQHMGAFDAAERSIERALELLDASGNVIDVPLCHIHMGSLRAHQGRPDEAMVYEQLALQASKRMGDVVQEGRVLSNLGIRLHQIGEHARAAEAFRRAARIAKRTGSVGHEAIARGNLGETLMRVRAYDQADTELRRAIALGDVTWPVVAGTFRTTLARLRARQGQLEAAESLLDEAQPLLAGVHRTNFAALQLARAEVSARRGKADEARGWIRQAEVSYGGEDLTHDPELALRLIEVMARIDEAETDKTEPI